MEASIAFERLSSTSLRIVKRAIPREHCSAPRPSASAAGSHLPLASAAEALVAAEEISQEAVLVEQAAAAAEPKGGVYLLRDGEGNVVRPGRSNNLTRRPG